ncbi:putative 3-methyladenine DNA glycosylase isoform X2 [Odontomachus brunneus]|uniref:putative 3-methyladenine DNA glycosylase isoform X2 n=1 Tax=Odontomachus brunneus TaxID=486640 RepID=UPI0013F1BDCA|nr:putative 3-methyladenine DNA glycosylase isoform X2 [Odontomachus brunneus]
MKRTRAAAKVQQRHAIQENPDDEVVKLVEIQMASKVESNEKPKLNLKSLRSEDNKNVYSTTNSHITESSKKFKSVQEEPKTKTLIKKEELKPNTKVSKKKPRAVVDLQMMKEELKQLEDPPITPWEKELSSGRLQYDFFDIPCEELAQRLLGKILVRYLENGTILKGRIVETEGYLGAIDKASQTYQNKVTPRNIPMYMPPGTIYVYMTYGMYHCFNISSQGVGCAVLVRAVDPLEGIEHMADQRKLSETRKASLKPHELCNGPSKLCMAYQLDRQHNKYSVCTWKSLWIEDDGVLSDFRIISSARIGIDSSGPEWASKPLRYYIHGNKSVSKRDKKAEMEVS